MIFHRVRFTWKPSGRLKKKLFSKATRQIKMQLSSFSIHNQSVVILCMYYFLLALIELRFESSALGVN